MKRIFVSLTFLVGLFLLNPASVFAAEFTFDYNVTYSITTTGMTHVSQNITVTNLTTQYYAQNFSLNIFSDQIKNVTASDSLGSISPTVIKDNGQTEIMVPFNAKVVGKDQKLHFNLSYDSTDIAAKKGKIWEIIIPGVQKKPEIASYTVRLSVPKEFGSPAYFSPPPTQDGTWTLTELANRGISAAYGTEQAYTFNLTYRLQNLSSNTEIQEITLPPDSAYQKVVLRRLSHDPENVFLDHDGNWLAQYIVKPKEDLKIIAEGEVLVYPSPRGASVSLSSADLERYTKAQNFWQISDTMRSETRELKTAREVYEYVINKLTYDYDRLGQDIARLGALKAYEDPQHAVCMEFSDLFVAVARANGIPARELHGYAYTTNSRLQPLSLVTDVLHAWAEYYDTKREQWIAIDPTWGNTTQGVDYFDHLDFNHIVFAILGTQSDYPYPAGSFKGAANSKDVFIDFTKEKIVLPTPKYVLELHVPQRILAGKPTQASLLIENTGTVLIPSTSYSVSGSLAIPSDTHTTAPIAPYGHIRTNFTISEPFTLLPAHKDITIQMGDQIQTAQVLVLPYYLYFAPYYAVFIGLTFVGFVILRRYAKLRHHH